MKYISILRGINVSGQKKILMTDLKYLYDSLDFKNVVTYIQSGNVIFESSVKSVTTLQKQIEENITRKYHFHVPVIVLTKKDLGNVIKHNPFGEINIELEGTKVLVTFLAKVPSKFNISKTMQHVKDPEKLIVSNKVVYIYCPNGYGRSKLSNAFLEKILAVEATTRNWKTVLKLDELSN